MMEQELDIRVAKQFAARVEPVVEMLKSAVEAFIKVGDVLNRYNRRLFLVAYILGETSAHKYALAGWPYGKNTKGKKIWLLEMKREHRRLATPGGAEA